MDPAGFASLDALLTPARLAPYLRTCNGDHRRARRLYVWNIEISAAFWGPISGVEIAMRNAMHNSFVEHFGRQDWWRHPRVPDRDIQKVNDAEDGLRRERSRGSRRTARPITEDDVVAKLSFGFWASLLNGPNGSTREQDKYWQLFLHNAFPQWHHQPDNPTVRQSFVRRIERLRKFRNRVAHHEPIHARHSLKDDHDLLIKVADFIHADLARFIEGHSRVAQVLDRHSASLDQGDCMF